MAQNYQVLRVENGTGGTQGWEPWYGQEKTLSVAETGWISCWPRVSRL